MPNNKIYLSNLDKKVTKPLLQVFFSKYGTIKEIYLLIDKKPNHPKGMPLLPLLTKHPLKVH